MPVKIHFLSTFVAIICQIADERTICLISCESMQSMPRLTTACPWLASGVFKACGGQLHCLEGVGVRAINTVVYVEKEVGSGAVCALACT